MDYGKDGLPLNLPGDCDVTLIQKKPMPLPLNPGALLASAFANQLGLVPLIDLARGRETTCIAICDITRSVPRSSVLPVLIEGLLKASMRREDITILPVIHM